MGKATIAEFGAYHFEDFFEARLDDADEEGAGNMVGFASFAVIFAEFGDVDEFVFVTVCGHGIAVEDFDALGIFGGAGEAFGDVASEVAAAERDAVGVED